MSKPTLDEVLARARGRSLADEPGMREEIDRIVVASRRTAERRTPRARTGRAIAIAIPLAVLGAAGLTAGAVTVDSSLNPDVVIPVAYTTGLGWEISCTISVEGGSLFDPGSTVAGDYLAEQDWTGVGERIHELALEISAALEGSDDFTNDAERDGWAWVSAEGRLTVMTIPEELLPEGDSAVYASDCPGILR